jgi:hypothetical protein
MCLDTKYLAAGPHLEFGMRLVRQTGGRGYNGSPKKLEISGLRRVTVGRQDLNTLPRFIHEDALKRYTPVRRAGVEPRRSDSRRKLK